MHAGLSPGDIHAGLSPGDIMPLSAIAGKPKHESTTHAAIAGKPQTTTTNQQLDFNVHVLMLAQDAWEQLQQHYVTNVHDACRVIVITRKETSNNYNKPYLTLHQCACDNMFNQPCRVITR